VWIDDDAFWVPGAVGALVDALEQRPGLAMVAGGFCLRLPNSACAAWQRAGNSTSALIPGVPGVNGANCPLNAVVPIEACGFHGCAVRASALATLGPEPFNVLGDTGEDWLFCERLRGHGFRMACIPAITFLHIDQERGLAFAPASIALKIEHGRPHPLEPRDAERLPRELVQQVWAAGRRGLRVEFKTESVRSYGPAVDAVKEVLAEAQRIAA
jgi:hypothetical protein